MFKWSDLNHLYTMTSSFWCCNGTLIIPLRQSDSFQRYFVLHRAHYHSRIKSEKSSRMGNTPKTELQRRSSELLQVNNRELKKDSTEQDGILPQQVGGPDNSQVLAVHVGDVAECCQVREVSHEELQSPRNQILILILMCIRMEMIQQFPLCNQICVQCHLEIYIYMLSLRTGKTYS